MGVINRKRKGSKKVRRRGRGERSGKRKMERRCALYFVLLRVVD